MPSLSIIIPTHKRADILEQCLRYIEAQTIRDQLEVIVVSDGKDDKTAELFSKKSFHVPVQFFEMEKSQQGIARNRGVEKATGDYCLFIGDDIFLAPDACQKHCEIHSRISNLESPISIAVLGFTTWDPSLDITPVMQWLEKSGWQFGYPMIEKYAHQFIPSTMQHRFTYTSHISLPTEIAKKYPFREDVRLYGWEDMEWGLRLREAGIRLFYKPDAQALHHHRMTLEDSLARMDILGQSAVQMEKINPGLHLVPAGWKHVAYRMMSLLPTMRGTHAKAFLHGMEIARD